MKNTNKQFTSDRDYATGIAGGSDKAMMSQSSAKTKD